MTDLPPPEPRQPPTQPQQPGAGQWQQPAQDPWQQTPDHLQQPAQGQWQQPPAMAFAGVVNPYDDEATPILVTGILSLVLCGPIGIYAWVKGNGLRDRAMAAGWPEPGTAKVGRILGIVGTVIAAVQVLFGVLWLLLVLGIMGAAAGTA